MRSISVIILSAAEICRRSRATGCCCKSSFRHSASIERSCSFVCSSSSATGAAVAAKRGAHLGLTVVTDFMPAKYQKLCILLGHLLGTAFGILILYFGFLMAKQEFVLKQLTAGMQWPEWMFGMFVPISGAVLAVRYIQLFVVTLLKREEE